ncbi:MAG: NUDIX domain-containing protein [Candidatus Doudnabacteria bacterium]|nr:NUDIX domain-containing protein [Candidatus Doudnabacteria bacterium]
MTHLRSSPDFLAREINKGPSAEVRLRRTKADKRASVDSTASDVLASLRSPSEAPASGPESFTAGQNYIGITVVFFCHDGRGNFLLAKRSKHARDEQGKWDIGGGAVKFGETLDQAVQREVKEEYGARVLTRKFLGIREIFRKKTHWIAFDFKVLVDPSLVKIGEPKKFEKLKWAKLKSLPKPLHSQLNTFFKKYRRWL